jgi:hypothetical protein
MSTQVHLTPMQVGGRGVGRAAWAAIAGLVIGAALLAGVDKTAPAASATRPATVCKASVTTASAGRVLYGVAPRRLPNC